MNRLDAALKYAERGWPVYAPSGKDGESYSTKDAKRIRNHFSVSHPLSGLMIDIEQARLVVLTVEGDEGMDSLIELGMPPETLRAKVSDTATDLFFQAPQGVMLKSGEIAKGLTLKTKGYVNVPPSDGSVWINGDDERVVPFPENLASAKAEQELKPVDAWPEPLDLVALSKHAPELPRFIMDDWLPCGYATLFAGHGGVGKSGIALHLAVCIAAGVPFFGLRVAQRRVLYLSCEDRENVLHWRLSRVCAFLGVDLANLAGWLGLLDLVGEPTILWDKDPRTGDTFTTSYSNLEVRIKASKAQVLFVDGIADAFGGNENSRTEVKAFVNSLLALVPADDGAVLLVGHISKPTASNGVTSEGYSGSTGWHNSVRARWYLHPETNGGERTGDLKLELQKSNLGPTDRALNFRWDAERHLFVGRAATDFDKQQQDQDEQEGIMAALRSCPVPVPTAASGARTTFHVLSARPEFPLSLKSKTGKKRFGGHIEALVQMGAIAEETVTTASRHKMGIYVSTGEGWDEKF